jgi:hypothetical protein
LLCFRPALRILLKKQDLEFKKPVYRPNLFVFSELAFGLWRAANVMLLCEEAGPALGCRWKPGVPIQA